MPIVARPSLGASLAGRPVTVPAPAHLPNRDPAGMQLGKFGGRPVRHRATGFPGRGRASDFGTATVGGQQQAAP